MFQTLIRPVGQPLFKYQDDARSNTHKIPQERVKQRGKQKIPPKNECVMGACVSFLVVSDKVHTHMHPAS